MRFLQLGTDILMTDPEAYVDMLFDAVNDAGFEVDNDNNINDKYVEGLLLCLHGTMCSLLPLDDSGENRAKIEPLNITATWGKNSRQHVMTVGGDSISGLCLVLRIILAAGGVTTVKRCVECNLFFLPKRGDRKFCYPPRQCKNNYHSAKRKK